MGPLGQPQTQPPPPQVVALGVPSPPFPGNPLDPPLRSRFQARHVARAPAVPWPQVFFLVLGTLESVGVIDYFRNGLVRATTNINERLFLRGADGGRRGLMRFER